MTIERDLPGGAFRQQPDGSDEVLDALLPIESTDVADEEDVVRDSESVAHRAPFARKRGTEATEIHAVVHDLDAIGRQAARTHRPLV